MRCALTLGEIKSESGLLCSKVVDMEHKLFRKVVLAAPDDPPNASIHQPIFVATHIDALH